MKLNIAFITVVLLGTVAVLFPICSDGAGQEGPVMMYVAAASGLVIRADATVQSEKRGVIPRGSKVAVLEQAADTMTIDGKRGHWTRIEYDGRGGWVFGGFLAATPPTSAADKAAARCDAVARCMEKCKQELASPDDYNGMHEACDDTCRQKAATVMQHCDPQLWSQTDWQRYDPAGYAKMIGE